MTSIQSVAFTPSLSALRSSRPSPVGMQPVSWKIRPDGAPSAANPKDSFERTAPIIRSLDPQKLTRSDLSFEAQLNARNSTVSQEPSLSRSYLFKALDRALQNLPLETHLPEIHPLAEAAKSIRVELPLAPLTEVRLPPKIEHALRHPRSEALRERLSQRIEGTLTRLEHRLENSNSPRLKQMHQLLSTGLAHLRSAATGEKALSPEEQQTATMALALSQCMGHLYKHSAPTEQASRLQQWVLLLEERRGQTGVLTPQDLLQAARQIQSLNADELQTGMQAALELMAGPGQSSLPQVLNQPLARSGLAVLDLMQEMHPQELNHMGAALAELQTDIQSQWLTAFADLNREIGVRIAEAAELSTEAEDLIRKADELALRVLSLKPEPPKGFEDGLVSLIRAFRKILEQLSKDQGALLAGNLARILERRKGDSLFFAQLQTDQQFEFNSRTQRQNLNEQVQARYERLNQQLQAASAA